LYVANPHIAFLSLIFIFVQIKKLRRTQPPRSDVWCYCFLSLSWTRLMQAFLGYSPPPLPYNHTWLVALVLLMFLDLFEGMGFSRVSILEKNGIQRWTVLGSHDLALSWLHWVCWLYASDTSQTYL
jgi:hypothetical protein